MNVAAYCRVSTDDEDQKNSFITQKKFFEDYIRRHDEWNLFEVYADKGITGTSTQKRTNFNRMIRDALDGSFDLILTKEVSRFARNTVDTLSFTRKLKAKGVSVYFISDNINTGDNDGELRLSIMATLAQEESRKTSERVKWGIRKKMEDGWVYGPNLIGYNVINGKLIMVQEEAKIVQMIFDMFSNKNMSASSIARTLTVQGIMPVKRIKTWSSTTILRILKNEKYAGDLVQAKTIVENYLDHVSVRNKSDKRIVHSDHHEPIIDRGTWEIVQKKLNASSPKTAMRKKVSNKYWCSGKIICGLCNTNYSISSKKLADGAHFLAWKCIHSMHHGREKMNANGIKVGCNNTQINMIALNFCVKFAIQQLDLNYDKIVGDLESSLYVLLDRSVDESDDLIELKSKLWNVNKKKENLIDLCLEKAITSEEMMQMKEKYDREIKSIQQILELETAKNRNFTIQLSTVDSIKNGIRKIVEEESFYNNSLFENIVDKIIAYPHKLCIYFCGVSVPTTVAYHTHGRGDTYTINCRIE